MCITTTLKAIREHSPCKGSWIRLLAYLNKTEADDEELTFKTIHTALNDEDLLWCSRTLSKKQRVYLGAKIAETVLSCTKDTRVHDCVKVCFKYAAGLASDEELRDAADAHVAAYAAYAAYAAGNVDAAAGDVAAYAAHAHADADTYADAAGAAARKISLKNSAAIMLEFVNSGLS
jgi:hypothetical protein